MRIIAPLAVIASAFVVCLVIVTVAAGNRIEDSSSARSAAQLYDKYCSSCHGKDGRARGVKAKLKHARDLADPAWQNDVSDERIFNSITNGRKVAGSMPAFGKKVTEQEAESLVTYIRALKK